MQKKIIATNLCLLLLFAFGFSQYKVEHYTTDNGLPQNSIKKMYYDDAGFLWFATEDGCCRFNGQSFTTYNNTNLPYISQNRFSTIKYTLKENIAYAISDDQYAFKLQNGKLIYGATPLKTSELKLPVLNEIHIKYLEKAYGKEYGWILNEVGDSFSNTLVYPVSDTSFFCHIKNNIKLFTKKKCLTTLALPSSVIPHKFFALNSTPYFISSVGNFWGIDLMKGSIYPILLKESNGKKLNPIDLKNFDFFKNFRTKNGYLQSNDLLYKIHEGNSKNILIADLISSQTPINVKKEFEVSNDEKYIFFGTLTNGLYVLTKTDFIQNKPSNIISDYYSYYGLTPLENNAVLTSNGFVFNSITSSSKRLFEADDMRYLNTKKDTIFFYKNNFICKLINGKITEQVQVPKWLSNPSAMITSRDNNFIWIAYKKGVAKLLPNNQFVNVFTTNTIDSTKYFTTYCLLDDTLNNTLYIGANNSLIAYNYLTNNEKYYDELSQKRVRALSLIKEHLFIGTEGDGYYIKNNNKIIKMPVDGENYMNAVHCFVEDSKNRIWMPSNKGLFMAYTNDILQYISGKTQSVFYYHYNKKNGLANIEFNGGCQPCAAILKNENIAIPGMQGVTTFNPSTISVPQISKYIFFDKVISDKTELQLTNIKLKGGLSQYKFYWTSPSWNSDNNNYFEFNLIGLDEVWKKIDLENPIILSNLKKGKYILQLRKKIPNNEYATASLPFTVLPKWNETNLFYFILTVLFIAVFILTIKLYTKSIKNKNIKLEETVKQRTQELANTNSQLTDEIKLKNKIVGIISHDIITPLNYTSIISQNLLLDKDNVKKDDLLKSLELISNTGSSLHLLALNILKLLSLKKIQPLFKEVNIYNLIAEKISLYKIVEASKDIKFINKVNKDLKILTDENLLGLVIQNLINNAVKFTKNGDITFCDKLNGDNNYEIIIKDTGIGMSNEVLQSIKNNDTSTLEYNSSQKMGWLIINDIMKLIGGNYKIETTKNIGTQITICIEKKG